MKNFNFSITRQILDVSVFNSTPENAPAMLDYSADLIQSPSLALVVVSVA